MIPETAAVPDEIVKLHDDQYYIHSTSGRIDDRTRVLKHSDAFAVFDRFGEIDSFNRSQFGIFHRDTRFLSRLTVRLNGGRLLLLSSALREDNALLTVDLTNPDVERAKEVVIPRGTLHMFRSLVLWNATCFERLRIHNYGRTLARFMLSVKFDADFADIFEVRGLERSRRGNRRNPEIREGRLLLAYEGLDGQVRCSKIEFNPAPTALTAAEASYDVQLEPQTAATLRWTIRCEESPSAAADAMLGVPQTPARATDLSYEKAAEEAIVTLRSARMTEPQIATSHEQFNSWLNRSFADLHILQTATSEGLYPYAGVPWFSTPFGRDGILTALACLWLSPEVARGVLAYLAATQADEDDPEKDAQPGKILHETRGGEMAALGEVPFARYYGSVDSTPLFVMLAGAYFARTGDIAFIRDLWANVERALEWIDEFGDVDGDGFVEYSRRSARGLVHQGWKDSQDSVFHADGTLAEGPIALCEVQAYVYAAKIAAANIAEAVGRAERARELEREAGAIKQRFEAEFWCEDLATYALALDGQKRACRVRTSNAGHCLFAGIAAHDRARRVAGTLTTEPFYSGWGVRTVASTEAAYNPMSYHNGSVWPHDNAIIAAGFGRYGFRELAGIVMAGLLDASTLFDLHRLPELFCGFTRRPGESPTLYPTACSPQAWAAATPFPCLRACLGIEVHGAEGRVSFHGPWLPPFLDEIEIKGLRVGNGNVDLLITRYQQDVGVTLLRRLGDVEVVVLK
jgi:glycogen debranching enzyme